MISLGIQYMIFVIYGISVSFAFKRKFEEGIPIGFLGIIVVLYLFGLLDALEYGVYLLYVLAALGFLWSIYYVIRNKPDLFKQIFTPGYLIFSLLFVLVWWMHRDRIVYHTDALTQWALTVKNMMIFNKIPTKVESSILHVSYPPGISLFQYFWMKTYGYFGEGNLYRALNILGCASLLPVIRNYGWKKWHYAFWIYLLMILGIFAFNATFFTNLQVDSTVGIILALVLMAYFKKNLGIYEILLIFLGLIVITLSKYTTITVSMVAIAIIFIDLLFFRKKCSETLPTEKKYLRWVIVITSAALVCLAFLSWEIFYKSNNVNTVSQLGKAVEKADAGMINVFFKSMKASIAKIFTVDNGDKTIFFGKTIFFRLLFLSGLMMMLKKIRYLNKREGYNLILLLLGWAFYILGRIMIYASGHSLSVAESAQGFERYLSLLNITLLVYVIKVLADYFQKERNTGIYFLDCSIQSEVILRSEGRSDFTPYLRFKIFFILITTVGFFLITNIEAILLSTIFVKDSRQESFDYSLEFYCTNSISEKVDYATEDVYFISSHYNYVSANDYAYYRARYNNVPMKLSESRTFPKGGNNIYPWMLGPSRKNWGDATNVFYSVEQWQEILYKGFDYVYIFAADNRFIEDYGQLFESTEDIARDTLFIINKLEDGKVVLIKAE